MKLSSAQSAALDAIRANGGTLVAERYHCGTQRGGGATVHIGSKIVEIRWRTLEALTRRGVLREEYLDSGYIERNSMCYLRCWVQSSRFTITEYAS